MNVLGTRFQKIIGLVCFVVFLLSFQNIVSGQNSDDSLVGYWKFDETSGTTANDASGNDYHAELFNGGDGSASWTEGKVNGAIELDGVDDYLAIQTLNYTQAGEIPAVTVVAWVKTIKTGQSYVISYDRSENWRFTVGGDLSNGRLFFASTDSSGTTSDDYGSTELNDGNWHLVVASYDSSTSLKKFYLDGNPDGTITTHSNNALGNGSMTRFGTIGTVNEDIAYNTLEEGGRGGFFEGSIDEIRLYDRALTDAEVNHLYFQATTDSDSDGLTNAEEDSLGTSSSNTDTDGDGISDWDEINGYHTYAQISGVMSWTAAKADAESRGGYLATITSAEENSRVVAAASLDYLWLGGSDASSEGTWTWLSGEAMDYSNWGSGEPNDSSGEDYLTLTAARQWNDTANTYATINGYILETEYAPTNPLQSDSDGDGVDDLSEINQGRNPNLVELADWSSVGAGIWTLSNADLTVRQTENQPDLYYLTPYEILNKSVTFSMGVSGDTDNDFIGFVMGYEDSSNYYYFSWTKSESSEGTSPTDGWNLYRKEDGVVSTLATDQSDYTKGWEIDVDYDVTVSYSSGRMSIHLQGGSQAFSIGATITTIEDDFPSGKFGFFGSSQAGMNFSSLKFEHLYTPEISLSGEATVSVEGATLFSDPGATATDFEDGNLSSAITTTGTVNLQVVGSYQLVYTATDSSGIDVQVSRTVNVVDTTAPVITLTGDATITHEAATAYTDEGAGWADTVDGSGTLTASGTVDVNMVGTYVLTYDYTDAAGNAAVQVSRTVNVVDTTIPVITLIGDATITHEAATVYTDEGATWTDTLDGAGTVTASGTVDVSTVGSYTLTYDFTDAAGNTAVQVSRTVNVVDTTIPVISLYGDHNVSHPVWTPYVDAGATAFDSLEGNLSSSVVSTSNVDEGVPGRYVITYNVQDSEGNQAIELTREIHVYNQNPTAILLSNFTIDENLPVGTEVGEFSTSDPDDLDNNKSYQYLIVGGRGHERFSLSSDGILTSAFVFDYEAENTFEIRVRTQDVFGAIFDQNFTINVVDTFHPIVETKEVFDIGINSAFFRGDVLDEGALSGVFERGFLVSTAPEPFYGDLSAIQVNVGNGSGAFEASTDSLKGGTIYYVAAYAMNSEGINYGSSKKFKTDLVDGPLFIANAKKVEGAQGWWESSWLGAFYEVEQNGWVLHADMGWLFLVPDTLKEGMWFWKEGLAWIWTDSATYPYFFSQNFNGWVFFFGSDENHTLFYDYQHQHWLQIKK